MIDNKFSALILDNLQKGITAPDIADIVPEDLEQQAHNTLWRVADPNQLTLLKLIPQTPATSIEHKFDQIVSYGERRGDGFFGETSLPLGTKPQFRRKTVNIRLIGEWSETYLLASLQKTIKVEGETGADAISKTLLMFNLLEKKNRALYFADTSTTRLGGDGQRWKGILQLIREGTDGTDGPASPYGSHIIDMQGQPLTVETIRAKAARIITLFGRMNVLIMDPFARATFEGTMDAAQRLNLPIIARAFMLGQNIGGIHTQGGDIVFHTDNTLHPLYSQMQYVASPMPEAPSTPPAASAVVNGSPTGSNVSSWIAGDAQECFWIVTEIKNGRESLGRRVPVSGTVAVDIGNEVAFTITPTDPLSDSFKIYRSVKATDADTAAYGIFEVANSNSGGPVTAYDLNQRRPGTSCAFALNIRTAATEFLHQFPTGTRSQYSLAQEENERFFQMADNPLNTISFASLGPTMGTIDLATILPTTSRPLLYSAGAPECRNAYQNIVFINVGTDLPA